METRGFVARRGGRLLLPWLVLAGCAGARTAPMPTDFPFHALGQQLDLHWLLSQGPDAARVD